MYWVSFIKMKNRKTVPIVFNFERKIINTVETVHYRWLNVHWLGRHHLLSCLCNTAPTCTLFYLYPVTSLRSNSWSILQYIVIFTGKKSKFSWKHIAGFLNSSKDINSFWKINTDYFIFKVYQINSNENKKKNIFFNGKLDVMKLISIFFFW